MKQQNDSNTAQPAMYNSNDKGRSEKLKNEVNEAYTEDINAPSLQSSLSSSSIMHIAQQTDIPATEFKSNNYYNSHPPIHESSDHFPPLTISSNESIHQLTRSETSQLSSQLSSQSSFTQSQMHQAMTSENGKARPTELNQSRLPKQTFVNSANQTALNTLMLQLPVVSQLYSLPSFGTPFISSIPFVVSQPTNYPSTSFNPSVDSTVQQQNCAQCMLAGSYVTPPYPHSVASSAVETQSPQLISANQQLLQMTTPPIGYLSSPLMSSAGSLQHSSSETGLALKQDSVTPSLTSLAPLPTADFHSYDIQLPQMYQGFPSDCLKQSQFMSKKQLLQEYSSSSSLICDRSTGFVQNSSSVPFASSNAASDGFSSSPPAFGSFQKQTTETYLRSQTDNSYLNPLLLPQQNCISQSSVLGAPMNCIDPNATNYHNFLSASNSFPQKTLQNPMSSTGFVESSLPQCELPLKKTDDSLQSDFRQEGAFISSVADKMLQRPFSFGEGGTLSEGKMTTNTDISSSFLPSESKDSFYGAQNSFTQNPSCEYQLHSMTLSTDCSNASSLDRFNPIGCNESLPLQFFSLQTPSSRPASKRQSTQLHGHPLSQSTNHQYSDNTFNFEAKEAQPLHSRPLSTPIIESSFFKNKSQGRNRQSFSKRKHCRRHKKSASTSPMIFSLPKQSCSPSVLPSTEGFFVPANKPVQWTAPREITSVQSIVLPQVPSSLHSADFSPSHSSSVHPRIAGVAISSPPQRNLQFPPLSSPSSALPYASDDRNSDHSST
ncbi:uncharacterized protein MONOS_16256 [Monocercomonoides exilis]|uniref:uncharacterized protein n=1 Tax=Monocercomonoides exilis TaxID=2049356 RepID=UPI00355A37FC|nr:hypothetical protein MONOS_16256 [Monocercomonoides exilis]|eukprot:MONOS_16256.1-p1 / transcript=MONOS_16256.1 / gene=MONOS_16256 / organism=Monocercomonoides_exilis_PA203 / gene_product=unspecified product / transcript_product=unspecified product / location=Mono_scaffold01595:2723-5044(+) / protein_length=774 / sequence_SO=supercontig / SO=protein_coding / is_pseudo=false